MKKLLIAVLMFTAFAGVSMASPAPVNATAIKGQTHVQGKHTGKHASKHAKHSAAKKKTGDAAK